MVGLRGRSVIALRVLVLYFALGHTLAAFADDAPRWFVEGRPGADAIQAVQLLQSADADGLDPDDYQASVLAQQIGEAGRTPLLSDDAQLALSAALTRSMEQFLSDLHVGRINPRDIYAAFDVPPKQLALAAYLTDAVARHALAEAVRAAAPQLPLYAGLRQALALYRQLAQEPALQQPLPPFQGSKIQPGASYAGIAELSRRLIGFGDFAGREGGTPL
jgi:L,D-transpeptidase YcbB